jgi:sugar lactone lactonase YvrE
VIVRIDPDGQTAIVAEDLNFPNGMVIIPDGSLVVAESTARRLTAYDVSGTGELSGRRVLADGLDGPPDGLAVDAAGGVWTALTLAHQFQRVTAAGVTDRVDLDGRTAIACALGGPEGRTLFLLSSTDAYPERLIGTKLSTLDAVTVDVPAAY